MSVVLCIILFILGIALSFAGSIIGLVQSFQESTTWGLLYLFVPFASLVFLIKFWKQREWLRNSFFMALGGSGMIVVSTVIGLLAAPPMDYAEYGGEGFSAEDFGVAGFDFEEEFATATADGSTSDGSTSPTYVNDPFRDAINLATDASNRTQTAASKEEWHAITTTWKDSIALLGAVPSTDPNYRTAQSKIVTYNQNLNYAQQNAK